MHTLLVVVVAEVAVECVRDGGGAGGLLAFLFETCRKEAGAAGGVHLWSEK